MSIRSVHSARAVRTHLSAKQFARGVRGGRALSERRWPGAAPRRWAVRRSLWRLQERAAGRRTHWRWISGRLAPRAADGHDDLSPPAHLTYACTSCSCAVSTYCWKLVILPSLTFHTWQTCASSFLPVCLQVPV